MKKSDFTDIRRKGWIESLPSFLRPYAYLMRLDRSIGSWLLFWPGAWAIVLAGEYPEMTANIVFILMLFAIGAPIMRGAGCTINDYWDREIDKLVGRTADRPIAAGHISPKAALIFLGGLLVLGLFILCQLPITSVLLGMACVPLIVFYPLVKRYTFWPQLFLGLTFNFGALIGWAAVDITVSQIAVILYLAAIFWTLGYDTIYAFQDIEDDLTIGVKSTAILFRDNPLPVICLFYMGCVTLVGYALYLASASLWSFVALMPAGIYALSMIYAWNPGAPESSLLTFKRNKIFGAWVFLACLVTGLLA